MPVKRYTPEIGCKDYCEYAYMSNDEHGDWVAYHDFFRVVTALEIMGTLISAQGATHLGASVANLVDEYKEDK